MMAMGMTTRLWLVWSGADSTRLGLQIHSQRKRTGVLAPKRFVQRLKKDNELFRSYMHQAIP